MDLFPNSLDFKYSFKLVKREKNPIESGIANLKRTRKSNAVLPYKHIRNNIEKGSVQFIFFLKCLQRSPSTETFWFSLLS